MGNTRLLWIATLAGAASLAACSTRQEDATAANTSTSEPVAATGVTRNVVPTPTPTPSPTPMTVAAIQTQPGPRGSQVALNRVAVTGDVLTVSLTYTGTDCCAYTKVDQISVIDDATSQRLGVLKDNQGQPMAAPLYNDGREIRIDMNKPAIVWAKFPAPPATSKTVSIAIPDVAPFDAVPITR